MTDPSPEAQPVVGEPTDWSPTRALGRAVLLVALFALVAVFTRRPDMVVLAAPIAIGAALGLWRRPRSAPQAHLTLHDPVLAESSSLRGSIDIANHDQMRYDLVVARLTAAPWLRMAEVDRPYATAIAAGDNVGIEVTGQALRWGRHLLGPVLAHAIAADGLLISPVVIAPPAEVRIYPSTEPFDASDAMPRAAGMAGFHRSRRPGEGGELAGVRMFSPGDRLRRIDWRVSLRTRELYVAATLSDRDAEIVVLLDVLHEAGQSGGIHGARSVLDTTVRAAAGIGDHYLHRGDRVSFIEYGWQGRRLRPSSGHRHYLAALEWLLDVQPARGAQEPAPFMIGAQLVSPNALVVVLTPMIDAKSAAMLARLARSGRFVVAVDTMPTEILGALDQLPIGKARGSSPKTGYSWLSSGEFTALGARLWRLERANTISQLREHGVPVVAWAGAGSLDEVLRQVSRMASAPKAVRV
jgi:uncharacterized protein (DUF58 family)